MNDENNGSTEQARRYQTLPAGEFLKENFLSPMGISERKIADATGIPLQVVEGIVRGDTEINAEMSVRLGRYFEQPDRFWFDVHAEHVFHRLRKEKPELFEGGEPTS